MGPQCDDTFTPLGVLILHSGAREGMISMKGAVYIPTPDELK